MLAPWHPLNAFSVPRPGQTLEQVKASKSLLSLLLASTLCRLSPALATKCIINTSTLLDMTVGVQVILLCCTLCENLVKAVRTSFCVVLKDGRVRGR